MQLTIKTYMISSSRSKLSFADLKNEIDLIRRTHPTLKEDAAFVLWFLRAYITDSENEAVEALTGKSNDKDVDAVFFDQRAKQIDIIQGKFHHSINEFSEKRNDVLATADISLLPWQKKEAVQAYFRKIDPLVRVKLEATIQQVKAKDYALRMYYVTTGRVSDTVREEAMERTRQAQGPAEISIIDGRKIMTMFKDYMEGVAPAIPILSLRIRSEGSDPLIHRYEPEDEIESWVFSMSAKDVGEMYKRTGPRLFARNVRGYLGESNNINEAMVKTVTKEPGNFWYYNNGVTIICDEAKRETQGGEDCLKVESPQVINGQQTTRSLSLASSDKASVLVRVIQVPRQPQDDEAYDELVSSIVRATNWQNAIKPSDLVSNDSLQIFLERELRKQGYQYLRKRQTKTEARLAQGSQDMFAIKKEELAQAVAACELDPAIVRSGKEGLFDERYYRTIFSSHNMQFYLSRYWLMMEIQSAARGKPEWAYAKWLVLHHAWSLLSADIGSGEGERKFRYVKEQSSKEVLYPLGRALDGIFKASLAFFRAERGKGQKARDVSTFFQLTKLHERFGTYWASRANVQRQNVNRRLSEFRKGLISVDVSERKRS